MKKLLVLLSAVMAVMLMVTGCSSDDTTADSTGDTTDTTTTDTTQATIPTFSISVEIVDQGSTTLEFTDKDAASIGPSEIQAAVKDQDNAVESSTYTGITLEDFLSFVKVTDYKVMSIESVTGMSEELDTSRLVEGGAGFCWMRDGEALSADEGPVLFVNDGRGPKHWISQVASITIVK